MQEGAVRLLIAMIAALSTFAMAAGPVDAKSGAKAKKKATITYQRRSAKSQRFDPNDPKCIEAESLDPTGTYAAYPCWARAALAPKGNDGGWR